MEEKMDHKVVVKAEEEEEIELLLVDIQQLKGGENKMRKEKRIAGHLMKVKGQKAKVRVRPHLRKVRTNYK